MSHAQFNPRFVMHAGDVPRPELPHRAREPGWPAAVDGGLPDVRGVDDAARLLGVGHVGRHEQAHLRHARRAGGHAAPHAGRQDAGTGGCQPIEDGI